MLDLKWKDISDCLTVSTQKTKEVIRFKLTPELNETLARLKNDSDYLFPTRSGKTYTSKGFASIWHRAMAAFVSSGGNRFHEHDLRGKVATDIDDPIAAQKLLGHKSIRMTEGYIKQRQTDVVEPARRKK